MKQLTLQQFENQRQSIVNQKLLQTVKNLWSSVVLPKSDQHIPDYNIDSLAINKVDYYHVTSDLKSNPVLTKAKFPQKGATFVLFTTESGAKYITYSICDKQEKIFNKKLGVFYALKSALKSGALPVSQLFSGVDFKALVGSNKITENELIVKNLSTWLATQVNPLYKKTKLPSYKSAEQILFNNLSKKFEEASNVTVRYQFVQIRKAIVDGVSVAATTSYLAANKENSIISAKGGLTVFMATVTNTEANESFVMFSEALCSSKDVFDKTTGRYFALLKMAKETGYVVNLEKSDTDFQVIIDFYSNVIQQPISHKTQS